MVAEWGQQRRYEMKRFQGGLHTRLDATARTILRSRLSWRRSEPSQNRVRARPAYIGAETADVRSWNRSTPGATGLFDPPKRYLEGAPTTSREQAWRPTSIKHWTPAQNDAPPAGDKNTGLPKRRLEDCAHLAGDFFNAIDS